MLGDGGAGAGAVASSIGPGALDHVQLTGFGARGGRRAWGEVRSWPDTRPGRDGTGGELGLGRVQLTGFRAYDGEERACDPYHACGLSVIRCPKYAAAAGHPSDFYSDNAPHSIMMALRRRPCRVLRKRGQGGKGAARQQEAGRLSIMMTSRCVTCGLLVACLSKHGGVVHMNLLSKWPRTEHATPSDSKKFPHTRVAAF